jgi:hypothetical protein
LARRASYLDSLPLWYLNVVVEHSAGYSTGSGQPYGHEQAGNYSLAQVAGFEQDEGEDSLALQALSGGDELELVRIDIRYVVWTMY